jgi:hypothetical protein
LKEKGEGEKRSGALISIQKFEKNEQNFSK